MKRKQITENINAALKSGDTTRPIIGRDAYAPKNGNGNAAKKTLTALVKEAEASAARADEQAKRTIRNANEAMESKLLAMAYRKGAEHAARTAKWCAAIAAASAIISIITAAI